MAGAGERKGKKDDNGIGTALDFVLANARLVLGVGGAAVLGIATLAVKRVSAGIGDGGGSSGAAPSFGSARGLLVLGICWMIDHPGTAPKRHLERSWSSNVIGPCSSSCRCRCASSKPWF